MSITEITHHTVDARVRMFRAEHDEVTCFAVMCAALVAVFDTFTTPEDAREMMCLLAPDIAGRPLVVINSHQHSDHTWGNAVFAVGSQYPAPILAHRASSSHLGAQRAKLEARRPQQARLANVRVIEPTVYLSDRCTLNGGDLTLELIHAPGHTDDQLVLWIPEIRTLLAADALESPFPYVADTGNISAMLATLGMLENLEPEAVLPCHGGVHTVGLISANRLYFGWLEGNIRSGISPDIRMVAEQFAFGPMDAAYETFHTLNIHAFSEGPREKPSVLG